MGKWDLGVRAYAHRHRGFKVIDGVKEEARQLHASTDDRTVKERSPSLLCVSMWSLEMAWGRRAVTRITVRAFGCYYIAHWEMPHYCGCRIVGLQRRATIIEDEMITS